MDSGIVAISDRPDPCGAAQAGFFNLEAIEMFDVRAGAQLLSFPLFAGAGGLRAGPVSIPTDGEDPFARLGEEQIGWARVAVTPTRCEDDADGNGGVLYPDDFAVTSRTQPPVQVELDLARLDDSGATGSLLIDAGEERIAGTFVAERCEPGAPQMQEYARCP
jgi:hypothetical protein